MASTYTWSLQSGSLPPGISLDTGATDLSSALTGTPTTVGEYTFTVRCTNDVSGDFDDQAFTVTVERKAAAPQTVHTKRNILSKPGSSSLF